MIAARAAYVPGDASGTWCLAVTADLSLPALATGVGRPEITASAC